MTGPTRQFATLPLVVVLALSPAGAGSATAVMVGDVAFAPAVEALGEPLALRGTGVYRWKWLVKVYAAALYLPPGVELAGPDADVARRLEFSYLVGIERDGFGRAADALLARSFPPAALAPLQERLARLHAAYVDVKPGDRYALSYVPGRGTELAHNGRILALIEGADFARAYFAIWLGERPLDEGLRDRLLAR